MKRKSQTLLAGMVGLGLLALPYSASAASPMAVGLGGLNKAPLPIETVGYDNFRFHGNSGYNYRKGGMATADCQAAGGYRFHSKAGYNYRKGGFAPAACSQWQSPGANRFHSKAGYNYRTGGYDGSRDSY